MAISEMLLSGLELMVLGMGMVFLFLALLILIMQGMSAFAARFAEEPPTTKVQTPLTVRDGGVSDPRLIAAITAAVARYRADRQA